MKERAADAPLHAAFVMEQTLGHVTHSKNLRAVLDAQQRVVPTWLPVPFDVRGAGRLLPLWRSNWSMRASLRARRALRAALSATPLDALLFHTQVVSLFSVALMQRIPSIVSLDATPINFDSVGRSYGHRPAGNGVLDRQKYLLNRQAFRSAAALVSWSEWAKRSLLDDYGVDPARVQVIAPGAAPAFFDIGRRRLAGPTPALKATADDRVRLLFVGGDFERKGGLELLEALRGPLADRCELHVVTRDAVPDGPNVIVHRGIGPNSPELLRLFETADVFVFPSRAECLAVVLMEATAAGLPVITTDVGALGEAVRPGETGWLVRPGDVADLSQAVTALVQDAGLRRRLGRAGHELAERAFDATRNNRRILDLVAGVADAPRTLGRVA